MRFAIAIALSLFALPASATEIDFSIVLKDLDGVPIRKCEADTLACKEPVTLGFVASSALLAPDEPRQQSQGGEDKAARFALALKVHGASKVDLKAEDIALLKARIGAVFPPIFVGRAYEILDPKH